jgi:nicotinate-nucleotide--dimethylbenzimidazole phosphoribosyltransferase
MSTPAELTRARLNALAKPPGSLGRLEDIAVFLADAQQAFPPTVRSPRVIVFAGDHGVARDEGVSPYPPEVTGAMIATFASGKAAVAVLARQAGADLEVVQVGVVPDVGVQPVPGVRVLNHNVARGTQNLAVTPAMTAAQCERALEVGRQAVARALADGVDVLCLGEMGIGNTTPAAAVSARLLDRPATELVGPGTGLDAAGVAHKAQVVQRALDRGGSADPLDALADLGGFEIAALTGAMLAAEAGNLPVLLDGFIVGAAALVAVRHRPETRRVLLPCSRSAEPGHVAVLQALDLGPPVLDLGLRLGEASAATAALPLVKSAAAVVTEMALLQDVLAGTL